MAAAPAADNPDPVTARHRRAANNSVYHCRGQLHMEKQLRAVAGRVRLNESVVSAKKTPPRTRPPHLPILRRCPTCRTGEGLLPSTRKARGRPSISMTSWPRILSGPADGRLEAVRARHEIWRSSRHPQILPPTSHHSSTTAHPSQRDRVVPSSVGWASNHPSAFSPRRFAPTTRRAGRRAIGRPGRRRQSSTRWRSRSAAPASGRRSGW